MDELPTSYPYFDAIYECHKKIFMYYKSTNEPICLSYSLCKMPDSKKSCTIAQSQFQMRSFYGAPYLMHTRINSYFEKKANGCVALS